MALTPFDLNFHVGPVGFTKNQFCAITRKLNLLPTHTARCLHESILF